METAYNLQIFAADDRDAFDAIFATMAPDTDPAVQARRRWWCFDNPRGGVFALYHDGRQIAATCYLGGKVLSFDGAPVPGYEIGETATDPAHQRRGLFSKLVRACVVHAAERGRPLVYGTPNSQSTPGYAKLGFEIVTSSRSWMFLLPRPLYAATRALGRRSSARGLAAPGRYAISGDDYLAATGAYPRLSAADRDYLSWRLLHTPLDYRFARVETRRGRLECAMRLGRLGSHPVVVIAEYFLDGRRPELAQAVGGLRRATSEFAAVHGAMGIYLHGARPDGVGLARLYAAGVIPHRALPVCATGTEEDRGEAAWFGRFQLSDCDIG